LIHNNGTNPVTYPFDFTFEKLAQILKPGFIQDRVDLDHDLNNRMAEAIARGVTFYKDKKEHFFNPNLGLKESKFSIQQQAETPTLPKPSPPTMNLEKTTSKEPQVLTTTKESIFSFSMKMVVKTID
jgi:hypothetical protein